MMVFFITEEEKNITLKENPHFKTGSDKYVNIKQDSFLPIDPNKLPGHICICFNKENCDKLHATRTNSAVKNTTMASAF